MIIAKDASQGAHLFPGVCFMSSYSRPVGWFELKCVFVTGNCKEEINHKIAFFLENYHCDGEQDGK